MLGRRYVPRTAASAAARFGGHVTASAPDRSERDGSASRASARRSQHHGWNFADVFEAVADRQPDALAQRHGGRLDDVGRVRPPGRRHRRHAARRRVPSSRTRWRSTSTTRRRTSSRRSAPSRPGLATVNTNYRYADDELVVPVGQRRRRRRRVPRHVRRARRGAADRACRASTRGCGSTTAAARARRGPSTTRPRRPPRPTTGWPGRGVAPATTCCCSTPAARRACRRA